MKHLTVLNKIIIVLLLICSITACNTNEINNTKLSQEHNTSLSVEDTYISESIENQINEYTIAFYSSSLMHELPWSEHYSFDIINIRYMEDVEIEEIINENIRKAATSWIKGAILDSTAVDVYIFCHSNNYLSFVDAFEFYNRRLDYVMDYITIDMNTGNRVMLNDLIRVDEEFVGYIQKNNVILESINAMAYGGNPEGLWEDLNGFTPDELLNELNECSFTQEEIIEQGYGPIEETIGPLVFRNSFYLRDGRLVIVLNGDKHITLNIDEISDFLKVKKW